MAPKKAVTVKMSQLGGKITLYSCSDPNPGHGFDLIAESPVDFNKDLWAKDPQQAMIQAINNREMSIGRTEDVTPGSLTTITKTYQVGSTWVAEGYLKGDWSKHLTAPEPGRTQVIYAASTVNPAEAKQVVGKWINDQNNRSDDEAAARMVSVQNKNQKSTP